MPIERRLDPSTNVFWTTIRGTITIHDLQRHFEAVSETRSYQYCGIIDTREAKPQFGVRDLPVLATHGRRVFGQAISAPRAVVVNKTDLVSFGIARLFSAMASPWVTFRVFDNMEAAVDYIEGTRWEAP